QDPNQRALIQIVEGDHHWQSAHQLRNQPEPQQILWFHFLERILISCRRAIPASDREADLLSAGPRLDDLFEPVEGTTADEEDVAGVDLDVLLLRMLTPALWRHRSGSPFQDLQQG